MKKKKATDTRKVVENAVFALNRAIGDASDAGFDVFLGMALAPGKWLFGGGRIGAVNFIASCKVERQVHYPPEGVTFDTGARVVETIDGKRGYVRTGRALPKRPVKRPAKIRRPRP